MEFHNPSCPEPDPVRQRTKRTGVTSVEYLFMASLIIVACIIAIQHVGSATGKLFEHDADKTSVMDVRKQ